MHRKFFDYFHLVLRASGNRATIAAALGSGRIVGWSLPVPVLPAIGAGADPEDSFGQSAMRSKAASGQTFGRGRVLETEPRRKPASARACRQRPQVYSGAAAGHECGGPSRIRRSAAEPALVRKGRYRDGRARQVTASAPVGGDPFGSRPSGCGRCPLGRTAHGRDGRIARPLQVPGAGPAPEASGGAGFRCTPDASRLSDRIDIANKVL